MNHTKKNKIKTANKTRKNTDISNIKKINKIFQKTLDKKLILKLEKEFKRKMVHTSKSIPSLLKQYSYYTEIKKKENYLKYYIIDSNNKHTCILDLEKIGQKFSFFSVSDVAISNNEDYISFSVDTVGSRFHTIYIKRFFDNRIYKIISDVDGNFSLSYDGKSIYYIKMNDSMRPYKLYSYCLETNKHNEIFTEKDETFSLAVSMTSNRNHVLLSSFSWESSHCYLIEKDKLTLLHKKEKDLNYFVENYMNIWYIFYTKDDVSKILYTNDFKKYETLIHNKPNIEYNNCLIKNNYLCCIYKENGFDNMLSINLLTQKKRHFIFDKPVASFSFPNISNLDTSFPRVVFDVYSNLQPKKTMELDLLTNKMTILKKQVVKGYVENDYVEKILHVNRKLCITMLYKKSLYKKNMKCLLNGYGAYGTNSDPYFDSKVVSLLDRGFLFCTAHVRGSGFHGNSWYQDGKLLNKINTFKDFISCAEFLIDKNYTSSDNLAIWGRSAGGLLIGAVLNMKPELFKLAILGVPFVDVLNTMKDESKPLTIEEYKEWGNPNIKKYETYIKKYDPISNIDLNADYPNIYIYSNLNDTLVEYKEPYKYYMKIKDADVFKTNKKNIHMNINLKYGHMQSSKRYENLNEFAIYYSIIINKLK